MLSIYLNGTEHFLTRYLKCKLVILLLIVSHYFISCELKCIGFISLSKKAEPNFISKLGNFIILKHLIASPSLYVKLSNFVRMLPNNLPKCLKAKTISSLLLNIVKSAENLKIEFDTKLIMNNILKVDYLVLEWFHKDPKNFIVAMIDSIVSL